MPALKNQAIQNALLGDWNAAISVNEELLKNDPTDIEALNRLAFAFGILGKTKHAKTIYQKVLRLDSQNPIALKNVKRLKEDKRSGAVSPQSLLFTRSIDSMFLEESGKTKVVELVNIAQPKIIAHLIAGELLQLRIKRLKIFVLDTKDRYVGVLPDNIGKRLIKFLKGGNVYEAYIKSVNNRRVTIFVKEKKRAQKFKNQPSFVTNEKSQLLFEKNVRHLTDQRQKNSVNADLEDDIPYSLDSAESF